MEITIENIQKSYRGKEVLRGIDLKARNGMCIGILGSNGSGKSTLLSILAGVQKADTGAFLCDGENLLLDHRLRSALVGYVPQGTPQIEELSAWDNLLLWYSKEDLLKELENGILKLLGIQEFLRKRVSKLSGGMKKRLSIGCAVANRRPILLLDEPTAALDLSCKENIAAYLLQYKRSGGILLLTTHDVMELSLCDQWFIIKDGVLVPYTYDGNVSKLVASL